VSNLINRPEYLQQLIESKDTDFVKIVTGIRRCGKSSMLKLFEEWLLENGVSGGNVIHMNMESLKHRDLLNYIALYDYIGAKITAGQKFYLLFDELQEVSNWEKAIESFRLDFDVDIYITGSNAFMLSAEFSTLLSGRYIEIKMMPLSFKEFLSFYDFEDNMPIQDRFQKYLQFGGMPSLSQFGFNETRSNEALEGIYSTVILKDILMRSKTADNSLLDKIVRFLCDNIGSVTSPNNIGNVLSESGDIVKRKGADKNVAGKTVEKYISLLRDAFVFYSVGRYDVKGKQLLKTLGKNYIVDLGFRNILLGYRDQNRGHILENVVFLELLRRGYRVYIGKVGETEVDFVAEKPDEKMYVQVTESMTGEEVRERELRPLRLIQDNYEKIVLSMDKSYIKSYEGIKALNIVDFLLEKES